MSDIIPVRQGGDMVAYNPAGDIGDQIASNFQQRGERAAQLVVAALTETAGFAPVVDGREFSRDVIDGPWRHPDETGPYPTVVEARDVLAGYVRARVSGADDLQLATLPTRYRQIARILWPGWREDSAYTAAFEAGLQQQAGHMGIELANAGQAREILRRAPRSVAGLPMSDHRGGYTSDNTHDFVTAGGHLLQVFSSKEWRKDPEYFLATAPDSLYTRGGKAPEPGIGRRIARRVTELRSNSSVR